jgi:hypothetical protein
MISKLSEVQDNYSVTDKIHGTVKFGPKEFKLSTQKVAYVMLNAAGDAVKGLTDPHVTIWGKNARTDSWIASVEFSWAGARHVYFNPKYGTFNTPNIPTSDQAIAKTLELLLSLFLNVSQIATITVTTTSTSGTSSSPTPSNSNASSSVTVNPGSASYATDWPLSMGGSSSKKKY